jgi:hypothetical protein
MKPYFTSKNKYSLVTYCTVCLVSRGNETCRARNIKQNRVPDQDLLSGGVTRKSIGGASRTLIRGATRNDRRGTKEDDRMGNKEDVALITLARSQVIFKQNRKKIKLGNDFTELESSIRIRSVRIKFCLDKQIT